MARRTSLYRIAEILALIAGILGIVLSVLSLIGGIVGENWLFQGGLGIEFAGTLIIAIVFSILVLLIGLGSIFFDVRPLILGIIVIIFALFMPGVAAILGIVSGILYIVEDVA